MQRGCNYRQYKIVSYSITLQNEVETFCQLQDKRRGISPVRLFLFLCWQNENGVLAGSLLTSNMKYCNPDLPLGRHVASTHALSFSQIAPV